MKTVNYDQDELELLDYVELCNPVSVENQAEEFQNMQLSVQQKLGRKKAVNLRILESDLEKIKSQALQDGIPYQTLIGSILHRYLNGTLLK